MMVGQQVGQLAPYLKDLTDFIVDNEGDINWNEIGSFYRSYQDLYQEKVFVLPLDGDFQTLYYRMELPRGAQHDRAEDARGVRRGFRVF